MSRLEAQRAYQYVDDMRLIGVFRDNTQTTFVGMNFDDNAVAYLVTGTLLTKLEPKSVNHSDYDVLVTEGFKAAYPYSLYVVNPDDEAGQASNAIVFDRFDGVPVLDVRVDGVSVVKNQIADIDLTKKLDRHMVPNKLYGTDDDGQDKMYDVEEMKGIQSIWVNGIQQTVTKHNVYLTDIANTSKTLQKTTNKNIVYGTDANGNQTYYDVSQFAKNTDLTSLTSRVTNLEQNKQDKDRTAKDGMIAIMKNFQSVGSNVKLTDITTAISSNTTRISNLESRTTQNENVIQSVKDKDWKAVSGDHYILNHPISHTSSNITLTNKTLSQENAYRALANAVTVATDPVSSATGAVAIGSGIKAGANAVSVGMSASTVANGVAIGPAASSSGDSGIAIGRGSVANENGTAIGRGASVKNENSVAIGYASVTNADDTVSVGYYNNDSSHFYRRITNVDTPSGAHDASTKKYVDDNVYKDVNHPVALTNQNLDDYQAGNTGYYYAPGGNSVANKPSGVDHFALEVIRSASGVYTQFLWAPTAQETWMRFWRDSAWTAWVRAGGKWTNDNISSINSSLTNRIDSLQSSVNSSVSSLQAASTKHDNTLKAIIAKVWGGATINSDGTVNWGKGNNSWQKIPIADLNIFSASSVDDNTVANSIRSRSLHDDDIKAQ